MVFRLVGLLCCALAAAGEEGWTPLFNGRDLSGWYTFLPSTGKNNDPKRVFKVANGMIHILDVPVTSEKQEFGYMATEREYSNCRIRLQYKWGTKRFAPRATEKRDSGILYFFVGPDKVWPRSVECQIQEGDTGDFWLVDGTAVTTTVGVPENPTYAEKGVPHTQKNGRIIKSAEYEYPGDWNTVEVVLDGDHVTHIVNGKVNNRGWKFLQPDPAGSGEMVPLNKGRLLLQAEGAEVFYRRVEMRPLP
ncbi:MAG TPA: DUF1080 domain-containing protein [Bryobacteraceae bacterium]|nr:DUF1080 domain-containing protein [Bryobacteraceae bacterium]HWR37707.1 DUF1080 domain-containing protein [Clostridia bacterium]